MNRFETHDAALRLAITGRLILLRATGTRRRRMV